MANVLVLAYGEVGGEIAEEGVEEVLLEDEEVREEIQLMIEEEEDEEDGVDEASDDAEEAEEDDRSTEEEFPEAKGDVLDGRVPTKGKCPSFFSTSLTSAS